jgi:hypothetical protein
MMYQHPDQQLWMIEQDREHLMAQRALERAARAGQTQPGLVRGGISSLAKAIRGVTGAASSLHVGGPRPTSDATGSTGA